MDIKEFFIDPEGKNKDDIKKIGYRIVDLIAEQFCNIKNQPIFNYISPKKLDSIFSDSLPEKGIEWSELIREIKDKVLKHSFYFGHPRYIGHMITQPSVPSIFMDAIISVLNQSLFLWEVGPSAAHLEKETIRWLCKLFGYDEKSGGMFLAGGSVANLTALLIARNLFISKGMDISNLVAFCSDYSHFSIKKAINFAGLKKENLIQVETDKKGNIKTDTLEKQIKKSLSSGKIPFFAVATAGTTVSGSIDPISTIHNICKRYGIWLHIDAAHGGALIFSTKWKSLLNGISNADSIAFDPHKWLYNSIPSATILLKDKSYLQHLMFKAPYIEEPEDEEGIRPNQGESGIQGTRGFDALKLWASLKLIGTNGYEKIIDHCIEMAYYLASLVDSHSELELCNKPDMNIVCFRYISKNGEHNRVNLKIQKMLEAEGKAFLSIAQFQGKKVLRAVILNYCTQKEDIDFIVDEIIRVAKKI